LHTVYTYTLYRHTFATMHPCRYKGRTAGRRTVV
jgi:hypothetical protein